MAKASGAKLTKEQKETVLELTLTGVSVPEIARQLHVESSRVNGTVRGLINSGVLPAPPGTKVSSPAVAGVPGRAAAAAAEVLEEPVPADDGYAWSQSPPSASHDGFSHPAQNVKYLLERIAPHNDGLVGSFTKAPLDDEIAKQYGHGTYRIAKNIPGKLPEFREFAVSQAFGAPRYPRESEIQEPERPGLRGRRPWNRFASPRGDAGEDDMDAPPRRSYPYPPPYPYPYRERPQPTPAPVDDGRDRMFSEFARQSASGAESVTVTVIDKLSNLQEKTLQRMEEQHSRGPDTFVRDFFKENQEYQRRNAESDRDKNDVKQEAERKREEDRQAAERKREEDRRRDDDERHRRWQQEADTRHSRDMERIKEERQTLLELEGKKIELIRGESKAREEILRKEIETYSKRVEEVQTQSEGRIEEMQDSLKDDLKRGRNNLEKEHDLRKQALDNEHTLRGEMIGIKEEMVKLQSNDNLSGMLGQLVEGVKETIAKVVELKKFEMATPEDRAAAIGQQGSGNVHEIPPGAQPAPASHATASPQPAAAAAAAGKAPGGNGAASAAAAEQGIQEGLKEPVAQYILREWGLSLQGGKDPAMFVNTFMEWMKDETPTGAAGRKACAAFAQLMDNRDWPNMKRLIVPALPEDLRGSFDGATAPQFYNAAKVMICESVRDYWKMYLADKERQIEAQQAAQQPVQQPAQELPAQESPAAEAPAPAPAPAAAAPQPETQPESQATATATAEPPLEEKTTESTQEVS